MAAAGFGKAAHQRFGRGIEKQALHAHAFLANLLQLLGHQRQGGRAAHVDGNRQTVAMVHVFERDECGQQLGREIVHAVKTCILKSMQGHRFS